MFLRRDILIVTLLLLSTTTFSQTHFKMDFGMGPTFSVPDKGKGVFLAFEPKLFLNPQWSLGLRWEPTFLSNTTNLTTGRSVMLKTEYYLSQEKNRMFIGFMLGDYSLQTIDIEGTLANLMVQAIFGVPYANDVVVTERKGFGLATEFGVNLNIFRLSGILHLPLAKPTTSADSLDMVNYPKGLFNVNLGIKLFQIGRTRDDN